MSIYTVDTSRILYHPKRIINVRVRSIAADMIKLPHLVPRPLDCYAHPDNPHYFVLVKGYHRLEAHKLLGRKFISVNIIAQNQPSDNIMELWDECLSLYLNNFSIEQIAQTLSISEHKAQQNVKLEFFLSPDIKSLLKTKTIKISMLEDIIKVKEEYQLLLYKHLITEPPENYFRSFDNFTKLLQCQRTATVRSIKVQQSRSNHHSTCPVFGRPDLPQGLHLSYLLPCSCPVTPNTPIRTNTTPINTSNTNIPANTDTPINARTPINTNTSTNRTNTTPINTSSTSNTNIPIRRTTPTTTTTINTTPVTTTNQVPNIIINGSINITINNKDGDILAAINDLAARFI